MILGTAQVDITPEPGVELSGFAARTQPSTGLLDRLFAKALYLEQDGARVFWIHCDLIGFDTSIVKSFRDWARENHGLAEEQVMLSATHTHAGPCTIHLCEAGEFDPAYIESLHLRLREAAKQAMGHLEPASLVVAEGRLDLAVDRRKAASAHTDPRVLAVGFRRGDGTFAAAMINYAVHPVALGPSNRLISGDISGQAAISLARQLPGSPVVLMTNGASANLNPPAENVAFSKVMEWGGMIANSIAERLREQEPVPDVPLQTVRRIVPLPLDVYDANRINATADKALKNPAPLAEWGDKYRRAVERWRSNLLGSLKNADNGSHREAELFALGLGNLVLLGINAEVFSEFTDWLRRSTSDRICLVSYANGDMGYLPTRAAYAEGGYEVEIAHFFYGGFRPQAGGLELLAREAGDLLLQLRKQDLCRK